MSCCQSFDRNVLANLFVLANAPSRIHITHTHKNTHTRNFNSSNWEKKILEKSNDITVLHRQTIRKDWRT